MRRGVLVFILVNFLIIAFLVRSVFTLLTLLVEDASQDAIHRDDIPESIDGLPQLIPKIIHQTYINESIPPQWVEPQQSCINLHPDYEYMVRCTFLLLFVDTNCCSSGRTKSREILSRPNTRGFWKPLMATSTRSSGLILSATLSWPTTAAPTLT